MLGDREGSKVPVRRMPGGLDSGVGRAMADIALDIGPHAWPVIVQGNQIEGFGYPRVASRFAIMVRTEDRET
jgi:hypothetical protein